MTAWQTFAGRFNWALEAKNERLQKNGEPLLTLAELARRVGMTRANLTHWSKGATKDPEASNVTAVALELEVDPHWLASGFGRPRAPVSVRAEHDNVRQPRSRIVRRVPVLTWAEIGNNYGPMNAPTTLERFADVETDTSAESYALEVTGDSMEPLFPAGCTIIVDPARRAAPGDYVIAHASGWQTPTLKQFVEDAGQSMLRPTNPRYPVVPLAPEVRILGVVVERMIRQAF